MKGGIDVRQAVMISIRPQWCELIASGRKTVEVRKTRPKLEPPFRCYIYETQGKTDTPWMGEDIRRYWYTPELLEQCRRAWEGEGYE